MDERPLWDRPDEDDEQAGPDEGVRLIGHDEVAEVERRGDVVPRRADPAPNAGPTMPGSHDDAPKPAMRFPMGQQRDDDTARPKVSAPAPAPPWSHDATAETPRTVVPDADFRPPRPEEPGRGAAPDGPSPEEPRSDDPMRAWANLGVSGARWREWDQDDDEPHVDLRQAEQERRPVERSAAVRGSGPSGATSLGAYGSPEGEDDTGPATERSGWVGRPDEQTAASRQQPPEPVYLGQHAEDAGGGGGGGRRPVGPPAPPRDVGLAVISGLALALAAFVLFMLGPAAAMVLVAVVVVVATAELFSALQRGGYQPATLLALVATAGLAAGTYWRGEVALPIVMGLTVIVALLWYLIGVTRLEPTMNAGVTILGISYIGLLGSFAALILREPSGRGILGGIIIAVVANDVGALAAGRRFGRRLLAPHISPNKTIEGLVGGAVLSVVASVVLVGSDVAVFGLHPWTVGSAVWLGLVVAVVAPMGDLSESLIKRDLGVKDMSTIIPGHGGLLDRIDALLFCLPAVYYLTRLLELS